MNNATTINALGMPCPIPVVKAKQAIQQLPPAGGVVCVLVDNMVACENLGKMASGSGYTHQIAAIDSGYQVTITVGTVPADPKVVMDAPVPSVPQAQDNLAVAIGRDAMGHGSDELGKILIKGFIYSLTALETPPAALLFFNGGVHLVVEGANTIEDLQALESKGTKILVCGTCANYYNVSDRIAVGEIANMYAIVEAMANASSVINL